MKRICSLVVLVLLSSSAHAGNSFSFVVGGHRIHVGAARHAVVLACLQRAGGAGIGEGVHLRSRHK